MEEGLPFAEVCQEYLHYKIRRQSKSYLPFWACQYTWQYRGNSGAWKECWSNWQCILKVWVFL